MENCHIGPHRNKQRQIERSSGGVRPIKATKEITNKHTDSQTKTPLYMYVMGQGPNKGHKYLIFSIFKVPIW